MLKWVRDICCIIICPDVCFVLHLYQYLYWDILYLKCSHITYILWYDFLAEFSIIWLFSDCFRQTCSDGKKFFFGKKEKIPVKHIVYLFSTRQFWHFFSCSPSCAASSPAKMDNSSFTSSFCVPAEVVYGLITLAGGVTVAVIIIVIYKYKRKLQLVNGYSDITQ